MRKHYYYYVNLVFNYNELAIAEERLGIVQARSGDEARRRMEQFKQEQKHPFHYLIGDKTDIEHVVLAQTAPEVITLF